MLTCLPLQSQIDIDPANIEAGIKEALLKARESEAIAKYLGTSESKIRAGDDLNKTGIHHH